MASLLSTLQVSADALNAYSQALEVAQNNVSKRQTPGYAAQTQSLDPLAFRSSVQALSAGVKAGHRGQLAQRVWRSRPFGSRPHCWVQQPKCFELSSLQTGFDISGNTGILYSLNNLFSSFSAWVETPSDTTAQQSVLNNAGRWRKRFRKSSTLGTTRQNHGIGNRRHGEPGSTNLQSSSRTQPARF